MIKCNKHLATTLAVVGAALFVVCFFWGYVIPVDVRELHSDLFKMAVLGWTGLNVVSFIYGIIQWTIWGWIVGWLYNVSKSWCSKTCSHKKK